MITDVPGVQVGHWTDREARTGCTVVLFPEGTVASGEVRGGAPATRRTTMPTAASTSGSHTGEPEKPGSRVASRPGQLWISTQPVATGPPGRPYTQLPSSARAESRP